ncbi:MAG: hypothetical protein QXQ91_03545 [Nanopusillaceae archaeon]
MASLIDRLTDAISYVFDRVIGVLGTLWNILVEAIDKLKNTVMSEVREAVSQLLSVVKNVIDSRVEHIVGDANAVIDAMKSFLEAPFKAGESRFARAMYRSVMAYSMARLLRRSVERGVLSAMGAMLAVPLIYEISRSLEPYIVGAFSGITVGHGHVPVPSVSPAPLPPIDVKTPSVPADLTLTIPLEVVWKSPVSASAGAVSEVRVAVKAIVEGISRAESTWITVVI